MTDMPFLPEFRQAKERSKWITENASYFTVIRRKNRSYLREEKPTLAEAVSYAQRLIERDQEYRFLIYAGAGIHDTLAATVSIEGVKYHE